MLPSGPIATVATCPALMSCFSWLWLSCSPLPVIGIGRRNSAKDSTMPTINSHLRHRGGGGGTGAGRPIRRRRRSSRSRTVHPFDRPGSESSHSITLPKPSAAQTCPPSCPSLPTAPAPLIAASRHFRYRLAARQTAVRRQVIVIPPSTGRGTETPPMASFRPSRARIRVEKSALMEFLQHCAMARRPVGRGRGTGSRNPQCRLTAMPGAKRR